RRALSIPHRAVASARTASKALLLFTESQTLKVSVLPPSPSTLISSPLSPPAPSSPPPSSLLPSSFFPSSPPSSLVPVFVPLGSVEFCGCAAFSPQATTPHPTTTLNSSASKRRSTCNRAIMAGPLCSYGSLGLLRRYRNPGP